MKIRRRPSVYDAIQWRGTNYREVYDWLMAYGGGMGDPGIDHRDKQTLVVTEHDNELVAHANDWFIQNDDGKLFVCDSAYFELHYDTVHDDYIETGETFNFQRCRGCGHFLDQCGCET